MDMEAAELCEISAVVVIEARQLGENGISRTGTVGGSITIGRRYAQLMGDAALRVIFGVRSVFNGNAMYLCAAYREYNTPSSK